MSMAADLGRPAAAADRVLCPLLGVMLVLLGRTTRGASLEVKIYISAICSAENVILIFRAQKKILKNFINLKS